MKITDTYEPKSAERFSADTEGFEMAVLHDEGVYRHLRFKHSEQSMYWYDLVTWPGCLTFRGDMGTWTFARETDMVRSFFTEQGYANLSYWAEKLQGPDAGRRAAQRFSPERFRERIRQEYRDHLQARGTSADADLWQDLQSTFMDDWAPQDEATCIATAVNYRWHAGLPDAFTMKDAWEWGEGCMEWDYHFTWACQGIRAGLALYRSQM